MYACAHLVLYVVATEAVLACVCVSVFVCSVFVSLSLCRLAKPPVPKPHLWSPGKWLIWKYNHSGQDFISSLSDYFFFLSPSLLSIPPPTKFLSGVCFLLSHFSHCSLSHQISQLLSFPFQYVCSLTQFNTAFLICLMALSFFLHWVIHLEGLSPTESQLYLLREGVWVITNQPVFSTQEKMSASTVVRLRSLWTLKYPKLLFR